MGNQKTKIIPLHPTKATTYNAESEKENNTIGARIDEARKEAGLTIPELSELLREYGVNLSTSGVNKWTQGRALPNAYHLIALCHALKIEDGLQFFAGDYAPALNREGVRKVQEYREDLIASGKYKPQPKVSNLIKYIEMPISSLAVSAGTGAFLDEGNFEMVRFPESSVPDGADFGIRVSGDSMEPVYHDGQIVWVHQCETLSVGQVGIFIYDGEGYLKAYGEQEPDESIAEAFTDSYGVVRMQPVLISYNQNYPIREVRPENAFRIVGKVL